MEPLDAVDTSGTTVAVHAGFPNPAAERNGSPLSLDKLVVHRPNSTYFFRVRGHTWERHGVFDGDIAVVDRSITPSGSQPMVWWDEAGAFNLSPLAQADSARLWGTVVAIIHRFTS